MCIRTINFFRLNHPFRVTIEMGPKEPTRAQLSSRLAYQSQTPSFLLKFKNRMNGIGDEDEEEYDEEFEHIVDGREPVPRRPRPPIPERPEGDAGSEDEDMGDEKPQVVVLKEGKHLTEREAEDMRRRGGQNELPRGVWDLIQFV